MKKVLFVLALFMAVMVVNAQTQDTTTRVTPTKTVVKIADLPKAISDNVAKDYADFTIKDASSTKKNNELVYEVVIVNGTETETLVFDKDGNLDKKLQQSPKVKKPI